MASSSDQGGYCSPTFVILSGCAWPVPPLLPVESVPTDSVSDSLADAEIQLNQEAKYWDTLGTCPDWGSAEIWVLRLAKAWQGLGPIHLTSGAPTEPSHQFANKKDMGPTAGPVGPASHSAQTMLCHLICNQNQSK